jgi:glucose/arabinose dehydrogenase
LGKTITFAMQIVAYIPKTPDYPAGLKTPLCSWRKPLFMLMLSRDIPDFMGDAQVGTRRAYNRAGKVFLGFPTRMGRLLQSLSTHNPVIV